MHNITFSDNQNKAIDFCLDRQSSMWFMPPGMGKTLAWLETINETAGRTLVIGTKLICMTTWPEEIAKWGYNFEHRFMHGKNKTLKGNEQVSLINYEGLPWLVEELQSRREFPFKYVIYDELSKMKSPKSQRFKAWEDIVPRFDYRNGGTGTPVGAHLLDLYGETFVCDNGAAFGRNYDSGPESFVGRNFYTCKYSGKIQTYSDTLDNLMDKLYDTAISFDINDLNLPPITHNPIKLALPDKVREHYVKLQKESVVRELDVYAMNAAVKSGKKRQFASGAVYNVDRELVHLHDIKAERLKSIVDEYQGRPVMVFFEYEHDYQAICNALGRKVPALYGKTKNSDAVKIKKDWNAGDIPVVALHPRSAAYGLNMQDSGNVIVFYTVPWSYELINQGIARIWRQGQKNKVFVHYLIVENTEDERVYKVAAVERKRTHDKVMEALL